MSLAVMRENFFWHKVHSLTGIVPVGFYMVQHLTLNSFSLGGPQKFDAVIGFFEGMPIHLLLLLEITLIWIPLLFHAVYGIFITGRAQPNVIGSKYGWGENWMYTMQRVTGILLFFFLVFHVVTTTGDKYVKGNANDIYFAAWHDKLTSMGGLWLGIYLLGVPFASYHLAFGIWNFCIRWGITIGEQAQRRVQQFSVVFFVAITLLGWLALAGFLIPHNGAGVAPGANSVPELPTSHLE
jgi:succinate dehydrogenase / fumarate reductase cytochrome b subunit